MRKLMTSVAAAAVVVGVLTGASSAMASATVTLSSFKITAPSSVSKGTVTFTIKNKGGTHGLCISGAGASTKCSNTGGKGTTTLKVKFTKTGKATLYCPVGGHRDSGMEKKISVK